MKLRSRWTFGLAAAVLAASSSVVVSAAPAPIRLVVEERRPPSAPERAHTRSEAVAVSSFSRYSSDPYVFDTAESQGTNLVTPMCLAKVVPIQTLGGLDVTRIRFGIGSVSPDPVTIRPHLGIWFQHAQNGPGRWYDVPQPVAFTFDTLTVLLGETVVSFDVPPATLTLPAEGFWVGLAFDDAEGATGATSEDFANVGPAMNAESATVGKVQYLFATHEAGSFFQSDDPAWYPASSPRGGSVMRWEFVVDAPTPARSSTWGRLRSLYR
jgi:hypothetical protein